MRDLDLRQLDELEAINERLNLLNYCLMLQPKNGGYSLWRIERGKGFAGFNRYRRVRDIARLPRAVRLILRSYSVPR